eukprot:m.16865 g.16865  ORF g.16865 m.16865 type:complete len:126 (-) comp8065_c0_seq1:72-449(-)
MSGFQSNSLYGNASQFNDGDDYDNMDNNELMQHQDHMIREQDEGLEEITHATRVLKHYGLKISDELDDHNEMLDDLDDGMEHTNRRVKRETEHVEYVSRKAAAGGMMCCIFLLIVGILVVAIVPF